MGRVLGTALSSLLIQAVTAIIIADVIFSIQGTAVGSHPVGPPPSLPPDPSVPIGCLEMPNGLLVCDDPAGP